MLVIVKSSPDSVDGRRGVGFARDMAADLVLLQNGVHFVGDERLEGFCGTAYVLDDDVRLRGLKEEEVKKGIKRLSYDDLVDLLAGGDKVAGTF